MDIMEAMAGNIAGMFIFDVISILIGVTLLFGVRENRIWYKISCYSVCFVNAFLWGSFFLFRIFYRPWAFFAGGFCGLLLILIFYKLKKELINYLFCFWCFVKAFLICIYYFWEHSAEEMEERIILSALISSLVAIGLILILSLLHKKRKGKWINIRKLYMICSMFYGSFLITGTLYEFIYDVSTRNLKFLEDEYGYINFYKAIWKADWTEDGTGIIFAGICILIIMLGVLRQCLHKEEM